jgi:hypothetical protein
MPMPGASAVVLLDSVTEVTAAHADSVVFTRSRWPVAPRCRGERLG